jgi:RepB DNA-primase from phage plasmid
MNLTTFTPRFLSASEYVYALHQPSDHAAVLVRNRIRQQTTQRILPAETIASASFQSWLQQQNRSGADIFIGMNPIREGSRRRTKEQIREVRHAYLDLDEEAGASLQAIRTSGDVPPPNFVLDTSPGKHQVVWRARRKRCCVVWPRDMAETRRRRTSPGSFVCPDSRTGNTTRLSSCACTTRPTLSITDKTFRCKRTHRNPLVILAIRKLVAGKWLPDTEASRRPIGPTPNARSRGRTVQKTSFNASPIIVQTIRPIPIITRA